MFSKDVKLLIILVFCTGILCAEEIVLEIPDGKLKGRTETTITNVTFYSFQGIPYAQPPVGELRFQAPQPVEPWDGILDATYEKYVCYQVSHDRPDESENCLFINVYSPNIAASDDSLLPVMIFIHGGGFIEGTPESVYYGPHHFMDYDVIIASFTYRVGPFGFLSTGDSAIPGNAGLKDMTMALQWLKKNIKYFGGDPEKVTIFGESAGSAAVSYQILSPKSKGLFRAAISESGSALSPWAYQRNQVDLTYQTAAYLNPMFSNGNGSSSELVEYLKSVTARELDAASYSIYITESYEYIQIQQGFFYAPVVEHDHEDAFITKLMYEAFKDGDINKVPLMIGVNSGELWYYANDEQEFEQKCHFYDERLYLLVPNDMKISDEDTKESIGEEIKNIYSSNSSFEESPATLLRYFTDNAFVRSSLKQAELQSNFTDVYFYQFSYRGVLGGYVSEPVEGFSEYVTHGEELSYIFRRNYMGWNTTDLSQYPESDVRVSKRLLTMFTNFAKYLNPTPEEDELLENIIWPTVNSTDFAYLDIGSYSEVKTHLKRSVYEAWEHIYDEYVEPPYDTY